MWMEPPKTKKNNIYHTIKCANPLTQELLKGEQGNIFQGNLLLPDVLFLCKVGYASRAPFHSHAPMQALCKMSVVLLSQ